MTKETTKEIPDLNVRFEKLEDISCDCGHKLDAEKYKAEFGEVTMERQGCMMEIVQGLVDNELSLEERVVIIDMIVMQMVASRVLAAAKLDNAMASMPARGRGDN